MGSGWAMSLQLPRASHLPYILPCLCHRAPWPRAPTPDMRCSLSVPGTHFLNVSHGPGQRYLPTLSAGATMNACWMPHRVHSGQPGPHTHTVVASHMVLGACRDPQDLRQKLEGLCSRHGPGTPKALPRHSHDAQGKQLWLPVHMTQEKQDAERRGSAWRR